MRKQLARLIYVCRMMSWLVGFRWLAQPPAYPIDRPIFLLGTQGGGLTLLSRMLRRHPDVISAGGNHRYWTSADEAQNVYGLLLPAELTGLRYKAPPHDEFPPPRSWSYAIADLLPHYRKLAADATPDLERALKKMIRFSAQRHARDTSRFRFLDKSQSFTVRVGLIRELLKDCDPRFVLVPRDPYVSVFRAARGKAGDMRRLARRLPLSRRISACAEHYGNSMRAVFEDCHADNIDLHIIQFEQLLREPADSLKAVCEFVGLDFSHDMLPSAEHRLPLGSRYADRWYPLRVNVNESYISRLDPTTIRSVNHFCRDVIGRLGYEHREAASTATGKARAA